MPKSDHAPWLKQGLPGPRVVVLAAPNRPRVAQELKRLLPLLKKTTSSLIVDNHFSHSFDGGPCDLVLVLGGDGSILQSARQMASRQRPVLGVHCGKLGFLAAITPKEFQAHWPEILEGRFAIDSHLMLACSVDQKKKWSSPHLGLNELAILGGPPYTILEIDLYVDGDLATTYRCDGLILSTPVGSTAHNLSAGGPILQKNLQAFVICPISPHTLTMRPVVDSADRVFELVVRNPGPSTSVVVDGRVIASCQEATRIRVQRASQPCTMVRVGGQNDYVRLRDKLGWSGSAKGIRPSFRPRTPEEPPIP